METIKVMMVDDEPLIRKAVTVEMNGRGAEIESSPDGGVTSQMRRVEMLATFASGPELMVALGDATVLPDYLLVDMELRGEPTGGLQIARRVHDRWPDIRIIIFSGRFDLPESGSAEATTRALRSVGQVLTEALRLGASAFVSKNAAGGFSVENIVRAIACLERGERYYFNYPVMLTLKTAAERHFAIVAGHDSGLSLTDNERQLLLMEAAGCTASEISDRLELSDKAVQNCQRDLSARLDIVNKSAARVAKAICLGLIDPTEVQFLKR